MINLLWRYLDPEADPGVGPAADPLDTVIDNAQADPAPADQKPADVPAKKFAWGDEDRRKTAAEIKEDQEIELGYEEEKDGKKGQAKYSVKHIREQAKFLHDNRTLINAAFDMNKEFKNNPELSKAFTAFWGNSFKDGKYSPEYVQKLNGFLEGKQEQVVAAIEDKTDDIKEMETALADLDPDSPQAKILKQSIGALKSTRVQLSETLKQIKPLQEKLDSLDKFKGNFEETQKKEKEAAEDARISGLLDTELATLTAKEKTDGYHFDDPDDSKDFERLTHDAILQATSKSKVENDEAFLTIIRASAKAAFETISKRNERIVSKYLQMKQPTKLGAPPAKPEIKPKENALDVLDDLVDASAHEVFNK